MISRKARRKYRGESIMCLDRMCKQYQASATMPNGAVYNHYQSDGTGTVTLAIPTNRALELAIAIDIVTGLAETVDDLLDIVELISAHPNEAVKSAFEQLLTVYELSKQ